MNGLLNYRNEECPEFENYILKEMSEEMKNVFIRVIEDPLFCNRNDAEIDMNIRRLETTEEYDIDVQQRKGTFRIGKLKKCCLLLFF